MGYDVNKHCVYSGKIWSLQSYTLSNLITNVQDISIFRGFNKSQGPQVEAVFIEHQEQNPYPQGE